MGFFLRRLFRFPPILPVSERKVPAQEQEQDRCRVFCKKYKEQRCAVHILNRVVGMNIRLDHIHGSCCYDKVRIYKTSLPLTLSFSGNPRTRFGNNLRTVSRVSEAALPPEYAVSRPVPVSDRR